MFTSSLPQVLSFSPVATTVPARTAPPQHGARALPALLALALATPALAQQPDPARRHAESATVYLEAGWATHGTRSSALGVTWPWSSFARPLWGGQLTGHWDAFVGRSRVDSRTVPGERYTLTQLALVPMLRLRFDEGRSPWFAQAGIGLSVTDTLYETPHKSFSTRVNFSDHLAMGRNFGGQREHEVVLGLRHVSNAGIEKPNPGEDFIRLRYARSF